MTVACNNAIVANRIAYLYVWHREVDRPNSGGIIEKDPDCLQIGGTGLFYNQWAEITIFLLYPLILG